MHSPLAPRNRRRSNRSAFTLIEVLVVIVIIAILIALLVPALTGARRSVRVAQVRAEISQLEAAIAQFRNRFQMDPPSSIVLCERSADWDLPANQASKSLIRQMWPQYDFASRDIDGDGTLNEVLTLTGGECLVFFLGGVLSDTPTTLITRRAPLGFSKNPLNPFAAGGTREGPFFEFKTDRFTDVDATPDGFAEYHDPLPSTGASPVPYQYFSSYDGAGYNTLEFGGGGLATAYRKGGTPSSGNVTPVLPQPFGAKQFQIVSPGFDGLLGLGGPFDAGSSTRTLRLPGYTLVDSSGATVQTVNASDRDAEADNITNFHETMLAP